AGIYSVVVTDPCRAVTNSASLTILTTIGATALSSLTNCPVTSATFSTTPSGSGPYSFVWRKDGNILGGQTSSSFNIGSVSSGDVGTYSVTVSGACGSVTNSASLTVLVNAGATALTSLTNCPGTSATFSTTPLGSGPFSFVWRKDGNILSGQTGSSFSIGSVSAGDAGTYSVAVSGACGTVTNNASLTVLTSLGATALTSLTNCPGTAASFSTTPSGTGPYT